MTSSTRLAVLAGQAGEQRAAFVDELEVVPGLGFERAEVARRAAPRPRCLDAELGRAARAPAAGRGSSAATRSIARRADSTRPMTSRAPSRDSLTTAPRAPGAADSRSSSRFPSRSARSASSSSSPGCGAAASISSEASRSALGLGEPVVAVTGQRLEVARVLLPGVVRGDVLRQGLLDRGAAEPVERRALRGRPRSGGSGRTARAR